MRIYSFHPRGNIALDLAIAFFAFTCLWASAVQIKEPAIANRPETITPASVSGLTSSYHSADCNPQDGQINLSELLRLIQFYNVGEYCCCLDCGKAKTSGVYYQPGPGSHDGPPHDSDYTPQDWKIQLSELLRLIQFYNSDGYRVYSGTEDGFMPGVGD